MTRVLGLTIGAIGAAALAACAQQPPANPYATAGVRAAAPAQSAKSAHLFGRPVSLEAEIAVEGKSSSDFHGGLQIDPPLSAPLGTQPLIVEDRDWGSTHEAAERYGLRGSFGVSEKIEASLGVAITQADAKCCIQVGTADGQPISAQFDDYEKLSIEAGVRRYVGDSPQLASRGLKPFVGAMAGVARTEAIEAQIESTGFAVFGVPAIVQTPFYDESWAATTGLNAGVQWRFLPNAAVELETGVRYDFGPSDDDEVLSTVGLDSINDEGERTVIPLTLRGRFTF